MWFVLALVAACSCFLLLLLRCRPSPTRGPKKSVQIVVLGDVGHSPRMQYHALSIAQHGGYVEMVGYLDSEPLPELQQHSSVKFVALPNPPQMLQTSNKLFFLLTAPMKVMFQLWALWNALARHTHACEWMLVQNPPSIPTLLLAILVCRLRATKLVIDWHNFGYSILALKLGSGHPLVKVSKLYESFLSKFAYCHFTVTDAMHNELRLNSAITRPIMTLHDRPAPIFQPLQATQRIAFLTNNPLTAAKALDIVDKRTRLVVSSTSWTADEDFSVLLEALCAYSISATSDSPQLPELLVIITGKGPLKQHFCTQIKDLEARQELEMVTILTEWLSFKDYASLLGAADLGVSLHKSSSGVDLPMKVVDMFGAGLPVLGYDAFKAWPELVREGVNGKGFSNAQQMNDLMKEIFDPASNTLQALRNGAMEESKRRWSAEWDPVAGRLFGLVA